MADLSVKESILDEIHRLKIEQQVMVLEFARSLSKDDAKGVPGKNLLRFSGVIQNDELKKMAQAIEENCESVNPDEW